MRRLALALLLLAGAAVAADPEPEPVPLALKRVPADGEHHLVKCRAGTYWIAIPKSVDPRQPTRTILWCHGSNMNGQWYVKALQTAGYGRKEILIGPNGHHKVRDWVYNFNAPTYDTRLAYAILDDVGKRFKLGQIYVGGHSQGAYYTFRIVLSKPDRFAGAIPFAGGLLLGLDPKSAAFRKGKPGPVFAILHGEADPVVEPSLSDWAYELFVKADYPCVRYVHLENHNHWWPGPGVGPHAIVDPGLPEEQLQPVTWRTIQWVLAVTSTDPAALLLTADELLSRDRGADALFCVERAKRFKGDARKIAALRARILQKGKEHTAAWLERMRGDRSGGWAGDLYGFRDAWGRVPTVAPVMKQLNLLRKKHVPQAAKQSRKAWRHVGKGEKEKARPLFRKTVDECFTAYEYARPAARWLAKN